MGVLVEGPLIGHELTLYVLRPEALEFADEIRGMIVSAGLSIRHVTRTVLSDEIVAAMYDGCPQYVVEAAQYFMGNRECEIGLVEGTDAIKRLVQLCGTKTNPVECADGTIRKLFGMAVAQEFRGSPYYLNAIHRPQTPLEVARDLSTLASLVS